MQPAGPTGSLPFFWMGICRGPDDGDSKTGQGQTASSEKYADFARYRNYGLSPSQSQDTAYISRPPSRKSHACKRPGGYFSGPFFIHMPRASSKAFPPAKHPLRHTAFIIHTVAPCRREKERILRLLRTPDWPAENGDSVVQIPTSRFYPFGTSQPSQASGRTRAKRSQSAALLSSSVKTYARTSAKPVSPIKCPYTARPSRIAAKEKPYPGRVISSPFPASERASSNRIYPPSFSVHLRGERAIFKPPSRVQLPHGPIYTQPAIKEIRATSSFHFGPPPQKVR